MQIVEVQEDKNSQIPLKLFIYGSCQSDQYYHPSQQSQSRRPICLSDIPTFSVKDQKTKQTEIIPNPLSKLSINKIACGALHTIIATTQGKVFTFGCNDQGALGRGGIQKIPIQVNLNNSIIDLISAGDNHSIFASSGQGSVYFAGNYKFLRGQSMTTSVRQPARFDIDEITNKSNTNSSLKKVVSGCNHTAIQVGSRVYIRGQPEAHTVGRRINARRKIQSSLTFQGIGFINVEDIWCGGYHNIVKIYNARQKRNEYFGWGENKRGQLGLNHYDDVSYPVQIKKLRGKDIIQVAAGTNFSIFLTKQGDIYGCGQNSYGQLGLGEDYEYVNSQEQASQDEVQIKESKQQKVEQPQPEKEDKKQVPQGQKQQKVNNQNKNENENENEKPQLPIQEPKSPVKHLQQNNIYIKTLKKIEVDQPVEHINAGSEFAFGWNQKNLYSWGFGSNYVLLNGEEQDELTPFRVKPKILQEKSIWQLSSGSQHVAFLSYSKESDKKPTNDLLQKFKSLAIQSRKKLGRRRKTNN